MHKLILTILGVVFLHMVLVALLHKIDFARMTDKIMQVLSSKYLIRPIHYEGLQRKEPLEIPEDALREIIFNSIVHKLQSDYRWLIYIKQLYPTIDVSGNLRIKQEQLNYCEQAINQLGNDVITDESQVSAADLERKRLEEERRKLNRFQGCILCIFCAFCIIAFLGVSFARLRRLR